MGRVGPAYRRFVRYYRNRVFRAFFHAPPEKLARRDLINVPVGVRCRYRFNRLLVGALRADGSVLCACQKGAALRAPAAQ